MPITTGCIIADAHELPIYRTALLQIGCKIISEKEMQNTDGKDNEHFAITFSFSDVSQVFHAGIVVGYTAKYVAQNN